MAANTKKRIRGVRVVKVDRSSGAYAAGIRCNDVIMKVNRETVDDDLDFSFYAAAEWLEIEYMRRNRQRTCVIRRKAGEFLGIEFARMSIQRCRNRCIFCFIDQLPAGMRKSLYVKDEDCRHSFLNGNYITLCGITENEIDKIVRLCLSPLFISVHATDPAVRIRMVGNAKAGNIVSQLRTLQENNIRFHTQIVVCPGINDGACLEKTINDLLAFEKGLISIAVVPVGLTKHRKKPLWSFDRENALAVCRMVNALSERDRRKRGVRRLFAADELFLEAGENIPPSEYYEDFPQIENGVGLIRLLLNEWNAARKVLAGGAGKKNNGATPLRKNKTLLLLTSVSAAPFLGGIAGKLNRVMTRVEVCVAPVINHFFGESVTVAGLLTARDIIRTVRAFDKQPEMVIMPGAALNYRGYTLDGFSTGRIAAALKRKVTAVYSLSQLTEVVSGIEHGRK